MKIVDVRHCLAVNLFAAKTRNKKRAAALSEVKKQKATLAIRLIMCNVNTPV